MKKPLSTIVLLSLVGCNPSGWYKPAVSQRSANNDLTNCQVKAAQNVPTNTQTQVTGGYYVGYVFIPTYGSVDTNTQLRGKVLAQCMNGRGYQAVELPLCAGNVPVPDMSKPAHITEKSCFKSIAGGYYAIAQKK